VRRAVDLALDRRQVVAQSELGRGAPLGQMVGRNVFGFDPDLAPTAPDPAAARALLADAGYPQGIDAALELRSGRNGGEVARQLTEAGIRTRIVERPLGGDVSPAARRRNRVLLRRLRLSLGRLPATSSTPSCTRAGRAPGTATTTT
jgi:ABC-type transport system substrate-binding protein